MRACCQNLLLGCCALALLAACQPQSREIRFTAFERGGYGSPSWCQSSPDSTELLVHDAGSASGFQILRLRIDTGEIQGVLPEERMPFGTVRVVPGDYYLWEHPECSPVGDEFAVIGAGSGNQALLIYSAGGEERRLVRLMNDYDVSELAWAPDGERLAFSAATAPLVYGLFLLDLAGEAEPVPLELDAPFPSYWAQAWSPDGRFLAFVAGEWGKQSNEVYLLDVESGAITNLTDTPNVVNDAPAWSPDGQWIAFATSQAEQGGQGEGIVLIRPDGMGRRTLVSGAALPYRELAWSPDGQWIAAVKFYYLDENEHYASTVVLIRVTAADTC